MAGKLRLEKYIREKGVCEKLQATIKTPNNGDLAFT